MGTGTNAALYDPANGPLRGFETGPYLPKDSYLTKLASNPANEPWRNGHTDFSLMNLDNNPANEPWRNGMTDAYLMNLGQYDYYDYRTNPYTGHLDAIEKPRWPNLQNLAADPGNEPWRNGNTDTYLMNLVSDPAKDPWRNGMTDTYLQNLAELNPANEPWRNGMTDAYLMNMRSVRCPPGKKLSVSGMFCY